MGSVLLVFGLSGAKRLRTLPEEVVNVENFGVAIL